MSVHDHAVSRRSLFVAGAGGLVTGSAALLLAPEAAEAKLVRDRTRRKYGSVAIIGDSASGGYMNGLTSSLAKAGVGPYRFDIKGSRRITQSWLTYDSGVSVAKKMINDGFHPKAWVVALGSNDFYFFKRKVLSPKKEIEAFLDVVGTKRHVVWFTIWTRRASEYYKTFNSALFEMERRNSRFHVLDWAATAKPHPEWLKEDGAHLKMPGAKARNTAIAQAAVLACKKSGSIR